MKKWLGPGCIVAFILLCVGIWSFFGPFWDTKGTIPYIEWEHSAVISADGESREFSPQDIAPELSPGEHYRFSLTLPQRQDIYYLVF